MSQSQQYQQEIMYAKEGKKADDELAAVNTCMSYLSPGSTAELANTSSVSFSINNHDKLRRNCHILPDENRNFNTILLDNSADFYGENYTHGRFNSKQNLRLSYETNLPIRPNDFSSQRANHISNAYVRSNVKSHHRSGYSKSHLSTSTRKHNHFVNANRVTKEKSNSKFCPALSNLNLTSCIENKFNKVNSAKTVLRYNENYRTRDLQQKVNPDDKGPQCYTKNLHTQNYITNLEVYETLENRSYKNKANADVNDKYHKRKTETVNSKVLDTHRSISDVDDTNSPNASTEVLLKNLRCIHKASRDSGISSFSDGESNLSVHSSGLDEAHESQGDDDDLVTGLSKRMSTNGSDRSRHQGSAGSNNENITWRARVTPPGQRIPETLLTSGRITRPDIGLYAGGQTESSHRLYLSGSQYPYTTMPTGSMYSPAMYTSHMGSRYSYYPHYLAAAASYGPGSIISYPHIESYSAVLASMGSQVQHANQSQIPRMPYLTAPPSQLPHFSGLASSGAKIPHAARKSEYTKKTTRESWAGSEFRGHLYSTPSKDTKRGAVAGGSFPHFHDKSSTTSLPGEMTDYKVPSGKEGSMKHRILTRPPEHAVSIAHCDIEPTSSGRHSSADASSSRTSLTHTTPTSVHLHYPPHFMRGSIIELANSQLKCVEELQTDDFVHSADVSPDLKIDSSTVVKIEQDVQRGTVLLGFSVGQHRVQVTVEASLEHPFFVFGQGWSSCSPEWTLQRYGLECQQLTVGDVCISLTHRDVIMHAESLVQKQKQETTVSSPRKTATSTTGDTRSYKVPSDGASAAAKCSQSQFSGASPHAVKLETPPATTCSDPETKDISEVSDDSRTTTGLATLTTSRKRRWSAPDDAAETRSSLTLSPPMMVTTTTTSSIPQQPHTQLSPLPPPPPLPPAPVTTTAMLSPSTSGTSSKSLEENNNNT